MKTEQDELAKQEVKDLYKKMFEIAKLNNPDIYLIPISLYNEIMKRLGHLEDYLKESRKNRDEWKKRYYELKEKK